MVLSFTNIMLLCGGDGITMCSIFKFPIQKEVHNFINPNCGSLHTLVIPDHRDKYGFYSDRYEEKSDYASIW